MIRLIIYYNVIVEVWKEWVCMRYLILGELYGF